MEFICSDLTLFDPQLVERLSVRFGLSPIAVRTLLRRGMDTSEKIEDFLHPDRQPLPDWREMKGIDTAASIIRAAIGAGKKICVYGDYDADGVSASAILYRCLKKLGADVSCYIPSRHREGYGLNEAAVRFVCSVAAPEGYLHGTADENRIEAIHRRRFYLQFRAARALHKADQLLRRVFLHGARVLGNHNRRSRDTLTRQRDAVAQRSNHRGSSRRQNKSCHLFHDNQYTMRHDRLQGKKGHKGYN